MDPSPSDPNVIFIHPPFVNFPNSHLYPEGLSYSLMAANPEWFLDQSDFISSVSTNPNAIPYPPQLEPPRGWCPAKKKDLKALGPDGWPEGEEPRLRCTFCRRTYAGVNAKSMWRRHVYEKHKIAMSNRRDINERTRIGRGVYKEQPQGTSDKENLSDDPRRGNKASELCTARSKTRSHLVPSHASSGNLAEDPEGQVDSVSIPPAPVVEQTEFPPTDHTICEGGHFPVDEDIDPSLGKLGADKSQIQPEIRTTFQSPKLTPFTVPLSPYDPTLTPSFRHSPPRLPSDQPWRFPSPSHPLHSKAREICLSMLIRGGASPAIKGYPTGDSSSPSAGSSSIINTPCSVVGRSKALGDLGQTFVGGSSPFIFRASPRQLFVDGQSPGPTFNRFDYRKSLNDSPLSGGLRRRSHLRKKSAMSASLDLQSGWHSDVPLSLVGNLGMGTPRLTPEDPFGNLYRPILGPNSNDNDAVRRSPPLSLSPDEAQSPVVRNARFSAPELEAGLVGLGIGLMAPFTLATPRAAPDSPSYEGADELEVEESLKCIKPQTCESDEDEDAPPLKRRRKTLDESGYRSH
ncbi:hypothetical protein J3A83DRAFT_4095032 [Scleroderma citrinum]